MAQSKASLRKKVRSALSSIESADDILEAILELQDTLNDLLVKMDNDGGIGETNYESTLSVSELDLDSDT